MSLTFVAAANHAPGLTGRRDTAPPGEAGTYFDTYDALREKIEAARLDALVIVTAEHFSNFFMNNMPAFCIGLGESFDGPVEPKSWLNLDKRTVPGAPAIARSLAERIIEDVDVSYSEELKLDHGVMVPVHLLLPRLDLPIIPIIVNCLNRPFPTLRRSYELGRVIRRAADERPERIGLIGTGGLSHWPAMPGAGSINVEWDRAFLDHFLSNRREALIAYRDDEVERDAGPGAHEIRSWVVVAGACEGASGDLMIYRPLPHFAIGGAIATMAIQ